MPTEVPGNDHWFIKIPNSFVIFTIHIESFWLFEAVSNGTNWLCTDISVIERMSIELITLFSLKTWKEISTSREKFTQEESKLHGFSLEVPFLFVTYILL